MMKTLSSIICVWVFGFLTHILLEMEIKQNFFFSPILLLPTFFQIEISSYICQQLQEIGILIEFFSEFVKHNFDSENYFQRLMIFPWHFLSDIPVIILMKNCFFKIIGHMAATEYINLALQMLKKYTVVNRKIPIYSWVKTWLHLDYINKSLWFIF